MSACIVNFERVSLTSLGLFMVPGLSVPLIRPNIYFHHFLSLRSRIYDAALCVFPFLIKVHIRLLQSLDRDTKNNGNKCLYILYVKEVVNY